jgi:hypothetical protein
VDFEVETFVTHALRGEGFDASEDGTGRGTPIVPVDLTNGSIGRDIAGTIEHAQHKSNRGQAVLAPMAFNSREDLCVTGDTAGSLGSSSPQAQAVAFSLMPMNSGKDYKARETDVAQPLMAGGPVGGNQGGDYICQPAAFDLRGREGGSQFEGPHDTANIRAASGGPSKSYAATQMGVRRLMPVECERLQGFPDHFTAIPYRWRKVPADEASHAVTEGRAVNGDTPGDILTDCMADGPRYKALGNSMPVNMIRFYLERVEGQAA